jgi:transcriptional regulator with XRE-family HTH domain
VDLDIRMARQARGLSQQRLAELISVHPSILSRWERGLQTLPERRQWELTRVLGLRSKAHRLKAVDRAHDLQSRCAPSDWHVSLRERRQAAGLSVAQLAEHAYLHPVAVAQYESGQAPATLAAMHRIDMVLSRPGLNFADGKAWRATLRDRYRAAGFSRARESGAGTLRQSGVGRRLRKR